MKGALPNWKREGQGRLARLDFQASESMVKIEPLKKGGDQPLHYQCEQEVVRKAFFNHNS